MQDSLTLTLVMSSVALQEIINKHLIQSLHQQGMSQVNQNRLNFLSALDCGDNHASELARKLGVSRQMVAKNVKDLVQLGWLIQIPGKGKQKTIQFTKQGEQLISQCRKELAIMDKTLKQAVSQESVAETLHTMRSLTAALVDQSGD